MGTKGKATGMVADRVAVQFLALRKRIGSYVVGRGFYGFRHTTETVMGEGVDQVATDYIMGHVTPGMGTVYRESISDDRLWAVVGHVHKWLFGDQKPE